MMVLLLCGFTADAAGISEYPADYKLHPRNTLTFSKQIAPIIYQHCSNCHHSGQTAPFNLLTLDDVRKHADEVALSVIKRQMPPWPPEGGFGDFANDRRMSNDETGMLLQWIDEGMSQGDVGSLPPPPNFPDGWQLGRPDIVVTMPERYTLYAEGRDVYRNFVIPIPVSERRYVKAVEIHPDNPRILHHAFVYIDPAHQSRQLETNKNEPGFPGIKIPAGARMPEGHFLSWQPGKLPSVNPSGRAWTLPSYSDLVFAAHLRPSGKPEQIQASVGFYFTDVAPTNVPFKLALTSLTLDIPAGATNQIVEDSFTFPVDAEVVGILPHAHYLAREIQGYAILPSGERKWLIWIKHWDFGWQGDYQYRDPVLLPKGTTVHARFTYDNSEANPANPNRPPKRVVYGSQSSDEMAELWLETQLKNNADRTALTTAFRTKTQELFARHGEFLRREHPEKAEGFIVWANELYNKGQVNDATAKLIHATELEPNLAEAHYDLGIILQSANHNDEAAREFLQVIRITPNDYRAYGSLGIIEFGRGNLTEAERNLRLALRFNPADTTAADYLKRVERAKSGG